MTPSRAGLSRKVLARFAEMREGRGRKPSSPAETVDAIVRLTSQETGHTHWSTARGTMAARVGVSY
ncbi:MAG: hypothetical protein ACM3ZF_05805 [Mycobacterium leprae]